MSTGTIAKAGLGLTAGALVAGAFTPAGQDVLGSTQKFLESRQDSPLFAMGATTAAAGIGWAIGGRMLLGKALPHLITPVVTVPAVALGAMGAYAVIRGNIARATYDVQVDSNTAQSMDEGTAFDDERAAAIADLRGMRIGTATLTDANDARTYPPLYLDTAAAKALSVAEGASDPLANLVQQARAAVRADEALRSHAIVQLADDSYWVVPLGATGGGVTTLDGPGSHTAGSPSRDTLPPARVDITNPSVVAIVGVDRWYDDAPNTPTVGSSS